jgi:hypothetical protein
MDTQLAATLDVQSPGNGLRRGSWLKPAALPTGLVRHSESSRQRSQLEYFIATEYRKHFAAEVTEFMPTLASLHGRSGELRAAVGYRSAAGAALFLELYTQAPVEELIRMQAGVEVPRRQIVEVGSLACRGGRAAMDIVTALVPALLDEGFSWVVFTGADTVRNVFRRLSLRPVSLCIANKAMLGKRQHQWGSYYDHNPVVMAGRLADGMLALAPEATAL